MYFLLDKNPNKNIKKEKRVIGKARMVPKGSDFVMTRSIASNVIRMMWFFEIISEGIFEMIFFIGNRIKKRRRSRNMFKIIFEL